MSRIEDSTGWAWAGVAVLCGCAALCALLTLFLVPLYAGSVVVPVAVVVALASNVALPRLSRALVQTTTATVLPFVSWLLAVIVIGVLPRPEGDVVLPGGGGALQWVSYGVLLGGALAGTVTVVLSGARRQTPIEHPRRRRRCRPARRRATATSGGGPTTRPPIWGACRPHPAQGLGSWR